MRVLYKISDTVTKEVLMKGATHKEVKEKFGFHPRFPRGIDKYRYGKYTIERAGEPKPYVTTDIWREWEEMNIAAELLRTGNGKIVSKIENGKRIKFVEPKGARK